MALRWMQRLRRFTPARLWREVNAQLWRAARWWRARSAWPRNAERKPIFVVGCHRSGTNMLMWTLERSPAIWVYHEHVWNRAFRDYRLRPTGTIDRLIRKSPAPIVAFKPVCEAHLTDRFLDRHEHARAIWIYRRYGDVANSAVRNWGGHHRDIMRWIVEGDSDWLGWRGERLPPDVVETVGRLFREDLSHEEGAALQWWIRNRFFFDLGLDNDRRVLLVRYEDLVSGGADAFRRLFEFAGCDYDAGFHAHVVSATVGRRPAPVLAAPIERLCEDLQARLDAAFSRSLVGVGPLSGIAEVR